MAHDGHLLVCTPAALQLFALESALGGISLAHIIPSAVVSGDLLHITSVMDLIVELSHMPEGKLDAAAVQPAPVAPTAVLQSVVTAVQQATEPPTWVCLLTRAVLPLCLVIGPSLGGLLDQASFVAAMQS